jgi:hypothetical protein
MAVELFIALQKAIKAGANSLALNFLVASFWDATRRLRGTPG